MRFRDSSFSKLIAGAGFLLLLPACAGSTTDLGSAQHEQTLAQDRVAAGLMPAAGAEAEDITIELSVQQAVERAILHNLDARVAAYEALAQQSNVTIAQLASLPNAQISGGYMERSNVGASSSRSVITGQQSLEPSQSTERYRDVAAMEMSWNLLDAAIALSDAARADDEAGIAKERFVKVIQNVERDVYAAYWRALAWQDAAMESEGLLERASALAENINIAVDEKLLSSDEAGTRAAQIADRQRAFRGLQDQLELSHVELKSMLSLPMNAKLVLTTPRKDIAADVSRILSGEIAQQEWAALKNRPEMREEILKKNMAIADTRREVLSTFPGLDLLLKREYDSNMFLVDSTWSSLSANIVQSITKLITLPVRHSAAKDKEALADARRQALNAAIIAQTHIARARLDSAAANFRSAQAAEKAAMRKDSAALGRRETGFASGENAVMAQLDARIEMMRAGLAYAELQDAYAAFNSTLGRGLSSNMRAYKISAAADGKGGRS